MQLHGVGVGRGVVIGVTRRMPDPGPEPAVSAPTVSVHGVSVHGVSAPTVSVLGVSAEAEFAAVEAAFVAVATDLRARGEAAGGDALGILTAAAMMAQDPAIAADVKRRVALGVSGERAVFEAFAVFEEQLKAHGGLLAERATDLADVSRRIIAHLRGVEPVGIPVSDAPVIVVADDLAPADTAVLDLDTVLGFITRDGGPTSHTAILARSRSIPAIVGVAGARELVDGTLVIMDAETGVIEVAPSAEAIATAQARIASRAAAPAVTLPGAMITGLLADGTSIPLLANLSSPTESAAALALGAEGVGLFRTEFLFLDAATAPTRELQQARYTELLSPFAGKRVVVRVLDAGADKPLGFLASDMREPNPALGLRGLRALRANEHILRDQLTALVNAQRDTGAELWVMAPMVSDAEETDYFVTLARELGCTTVGVMAEVPSLALLADHIVGLCDFISIGTNDLSQYALAADRTLGSLAKYQDPWHPAVLRLIKMLGDAGASAGTPVGVCGEAAADPELAIVLVGLGATTLSINPAALAGVRASLATVTRAQAVARANAALGAPTARAARNAAAATTT